MSVRFLATCFIHSPLGSDVIPPMHTQRVAIPSVPMMMRHLAWQKLDSKEGEKVA